VVLTRADGQPLPAGSVGELTAGGSFVVGYDGRAFIENLAHANEVAVSLPDGACRASFEYTPRDDQQAVISGVVCR
jgi:outer membrane usher protein